MRKSKSKVQEPLQVQVLAQSDPFYLKGITELHIATLHEALYHLEVCQKKRRREFEDIDSYNSSKSHFIINLSITQENLITKITKVGEISFVDLVACERITDPKLCLSERHMTENRSINKSLSALSLCIENISRGTKADFRSSVLTK